MGVKFRPKIYYLLPNVKPLILETNESNVEEKE